MWPSTSENYDGALAATAACHNVVGLNHAVERVCATPEPVAAAGNKDCSAARKYAPIRHVALRSVVKLDANRSSSFRIHHIKLQQLCSRATASPFGMGLIIERQPARVGTADLAPPTAPPVLMARTPHDQLTTAEVPGYTYLGCYADSSAPNRALQGANNIGNDLKPASCCSWCSQQNTNYGLCGVQVGNECWCGAMTAHGLVSVDGCNSACNGDQQYQCGGFWALGLYSSIVTPAAQDVPGYSNLGCYTDYDNNGRILLGTQTVFRELDARICCSWCATAQASHRYCGVEASDQCRCDSTTNVGARRAASAECLMPCVARANYQCGSIWRMNLYKATQTGVPAPPAATTATTTATTTTSRATAATLTPTPTSQPKGGYSTSDKIALGVGIGIGIPTLLVTVWVCCQRR